MSKNFYNPLLCMLGFGSCPCLTFYAGWLFALMAILSRPYVAQSFDHAAALFGGERASVLRQAKSRRRTPVDASASYSRYSSDLQDDASIQTQQEKCRDAAAHDGKGISSELEFFDKAISGTKLDRDGLNALLAAAEAGQFNKLYFFSLSRLARESIITMPILKRLVYVNHVRVVSVTEGMDSNRDGWEMMAQILSMQHERYIKDLSVFVFDGQETAIKNGFAVGDHCFGYTTVPVEGSEKARRGRHPRPRMIYVVHPPTAKWVLQIFHWFVVERRAKRWIARELNRQGAPKDHRATTNEWHHQQVSKILANHKYIGTWPWGRLKNVRDPATGLVTQEERPAEVSEKWTRHFPHLRLIDDAEFGKAQELLQTSKEKFAHRHDEDGTFSHDQRGAADASPRHLLSGLIICKHCGRAFYVGGSASKYMFCPGYHHGLCTCKTTLCRDRAETMILDVFSQKIFDNPMWFKRVLACTQAAWTKRQLTLPNELRDTEAALAEANRRTSRLVDLLEGSTAPDPDVMKRLADRRAERKSLEDRLATLRCTANQLPQEPTESWVTEQLRNLRQLLSTGVPAAAFALRDLVGGQITVEEVERQGRKRHFLRGQFTVHTSTMITSLGTPGPLAEASQDDPGEVITLDFLAQDPKDALAEQAKALWDQDLAHKEIALLMKLQRSRLTVLLHHWEMQHGQKLIDGRTRRGQRAQKNLAPPRARAIADQVMDLASDGRLLQDIGAELGTDRDTVTAAYQFWHESRGMKAPDGRSRRASLDRKVSAPRVSGGADDSGEASPA